MAKTNFVSEDIKTPIKQLFYQHFDHNIQWLSEEETTKYSNEKAN